MIITCPHCFSANRVPAQRLGDKPRCGKCKAELFTGSPTELSLSSWHALLNNTDLPVVVDCWAPWCGPCKVFSPVFAQAAEQLEPTLRLAKLNTEANPQLAAALNIRSIPTLLAFKQGVEVKRFSGALPLNGLLQWLREL